MRKNLTYATVLFAILLLGWINLPDSISNRFRSFVFQPFSSKNASPNPDLIAKLKIENQNLKTQLERAFDWLRFSQSSLEKLKDREFLEKRNEFVRDRLKEQLLSIPADVVYRDPSFWSSSLWINVGEKTNLAVGKTIIAKNSPVLAEGAVVGVVEYVGSKQSRVRLITDSGLCPSVRVYRGGMQNREVSHRLEALLQILEKREDLDCLQLKMLLRSFKLQLKEFWDDGYLAKGELHGSSAPFWRSRSLLLKGIGFNFDFSDDLGNQQSGVPILKEGDLLATTGLDGVFPPGLFVGIVTKVSPKEPGSISYDLEVRPMVSNLNDLKTLYVLAPVGEE